MADNETNLAKDVFESIAKAAAGKAGSWLVGQLLDKMFGGDSSLKEIQHELDNIIQTQKEILEQLEKLSVLVVWETLENEKFDSATLIQQLFNDFFKYAKVEDTDQRQKDIAALVSAVLALDSGIELALTRINDVLVGDPLIQTGPGLIELCMKQALTNVNQNRSTFFLINAYDECRICLGALFHLQYQGAILLYNCYLQSGQPALAQQSVETLNKRLNKQIEIIRKHTPVAMNFVAAMRANGGELRTRIIPSAKPNLGVWSNNVDPKPSGYNVQLIPLEGSPSFYFNIVATDTSCKRFYFRLVANTAGDMLYASDTGWNGGTWYGLDWWSGVNRASLGDWILLPSSDLTKVIITLDGKKVWTYCEAYHSILTKKPDRIELLNYADKKETQIIFESMSPPEMFP